MTRFAAVAAVAVAFVGCGGDSRDRGEEAAQEAVGVEIVAAGNMDSGTGHHHLIVDADVEWSLPIPNDPGVHYHMGQAQTEFTLEDLTPGGHRIIAVVADGVHVPLDPPVSDTTTIVVR